MEQNRKKVPRANKTLDQVLREEMAAFKMGEEAIRELTGLAQEWKKIQETKGGEKE